MKTQSMTVAELKLAAAEAEYRAREMAARIQALAKNGGDGAPAAFEAVDIGLKFGEIKSILISREHADSLAACVNKDGGNLIKSAENGAAGLARLGIAKSIGDLEQYISDEGLPDLADIERDAGERLDRLRYQAKLDAWTIVLDRFKELAGSATGGLADTPAGVGS